MKTPRDMPPPPQVILFDLGGVLIELAGVARMLEMTGNRWSVEELWRLWLHSPVVRAYETGSIDTAEFGREVVREFGIDISPEQYLAEFTLWARAPYDGAHDLLRSLATRCRLAALSNTNDIHWQRIEREMGLLEMFERCFASHLTGMLKPDAGAYRNVCDSMGVAADRVVFVDDNDINVAGARAVGMAAYRVQGFTQARALFRRLGLLGTAEQGRTGVPVAAQEGRAGS
ncbi:MAG: HAD-IA family hydrolase [Chitinivibrionales bacterium]|nr:HAD-IA family hydrolase [Chitinivibrionales bacterium]